MPDSSAELLLADIANVGRAATRNLDLGNDQSIDIGGFEHFKNLDRARVASIDDEPGEHSRALLIDEVHDDDVILDHGAGFDR